MYADADSVDVDAVTAAIGVEPAMVGGHSVAVRLDAIDHSVVCLGSDIADTVESVLLGVEAVDVDSDRVGQSARSADIDADLIDDVASSVVNGVSADFIVVCEGSRVTGAEFVGIEPKDIGAGRLDIAADAVNFCDDSGAEFADTDAGFMHARSDSNAVGDDSAVFGVDSVGSAEFVVIRGDFVDIDGRLVDINIDTVEGADINTVREDGDPDCLERDTKSILVDFRAGSISISFDPVCLEAGIVDIRDDPVCMDADFLGEDPSFFST